MFKTLLSAAIFAATFGASASHATAYNGGYGGHGYTHHGYTQTQYGGNDSYSGGYGHRRYREPSCYWERRRVRVWSERYGRWNWVWKRVRICN
ncbi:MAG: hypothetical protein KDJ29_02800 [Hyphomicrobiales bacterium]|nr:hypothetical protein [Hyphomicrobiales bacterium]